MNKNEVYKAAFELAQDEKSVILFAFESTEPVVYEILTSEYTQTPLQLLREDSALAKKKRAEFLNAVDTKRNIFVISEVKLTNAEIEEHITKYKSANPLTHVVFDKEMELDFVFKLQSKYSVEVITSTYHTNSIF